MVLFVDFQVPSWVSRFKENSLPRFSPGSCTKAPASPPVLFVNEYQKPPVLFPNAPGSPPVPPRFSPHSTPIVKISSLCTSQKNPSSIRLESIWVSILLQGLSISLCSTPHGGSYPPPGTARTSSPEYPKLARRPVHQNRASPFASDFYCR